MGKHEETRRKYWGEEHEESRGEMRKYGKARGELRKCGEARGKM